MYFLRRLRPLEVAGERVRALRVSLNAPVLSAADLPVGPARAVIVVHREARGRWDASVGVRSLRGGEVAYWSFDGDLLSEDDLDVAADAALTFSESLGFLFDETALGAGDEAAKAFQEWLGGEEPALASEPETELVDAAEEPLELELDDAVVEEPKPAAAKPAPAKPPARTLSKFRGRDVPAAPVAPPAPSVAAAPVARAPADAPAPARAPGPERRRSVRQPLAKLQLVKRRSPEEERKALFRRLLTQF